MLIAGDKPKETTKDLVSRKKSAHPAITLPQHSQSAAKGEGQVVRKEEVPGFLWGSTDP